MQQVLVTGATGYIGRNVVRELLARGIRVIAIAHQDTPVGLPEHPLLRYYGCNLSEIATLPDRLKGETIDCVYHFAWAGTEGAARADVAIQLQNVQWAIDMMRITQDLGCKRFIGVGTITKNEVLNTMTLQGVGLRPVATYGSAKIATQAMGLALAGELGLDFIWVDLANVYGVGDLSNTFIAATLRKILKGEDLKFSPGTQNYDFVYIDDVARGFVAIGENGKPLAHYLIGSSHPKPLKDFILEIKSTVAPDQDFQIGAFPAVKGAELSLDYFDCSTTEQDTGFRAQVPFAEGIAKTFAWLKTL